MENVPIKLTVDQLQIRLNNIFKIDKNYYRNGSRVASIFLNKMVHNHEPKKRVLNFTIVDYTLLEDL